MFKKRRTPEPTPPAPEPVNPWASDLGDDRHRLLDASGHIATRRESTAEVLWMQSVDGSKRTRRRKR